MNVAMVSGHLGKAPELRYTQAGKPVCTFSLATTEKWTGDDGQKHEQTEWHKIVVFGGQAEACGKYLDKGSLVEVEGKLQTRSWDDKDGVKRSTTEIVASRVGFLGGVKSQSQGQSREYHIDHPGSEGRAPKQPAAPAAPQTPFDEPKAPQDEFPF